MPGRRAPWWIFVVAASFLGYVALILYQAYWGPVGSIELGADFSSGDMVVRTVLLNSPADLAGLQPRDRVLAVDGQIIQNVHDWQGILANAELGRPERWDILRAGERLEIVFKFRRLVPLEERATPYIYLPIVLTLFLLSLIIAFSRPYDAVARIGAWVLASAAIAYGAPQTGEDFDEEGGTGRKGVGGIARKNGSFGLWDSR